VSLNGGVNWQKFGKGLPTVAVHDLVIHPRDRDLVVGTHGRGVFIIDIAPMENWPTKQLDASAVLFDVKSASLFQYHGSHGLSGGKHYSAPNPPYGPTIYYYFREKPSTKARLAIVDALGGVVATLDVDQEPGLHRAIWNLRANSESGPMRSNPAVTAGEYSVRLEIGDQSWRKKIRVETEE
jgi:hypothetical protein